MNLFLTTYSNLPDNEKIILKELLNDIIIENKKNKEIIKQNEGKKSILTDDLVKKFIDGVNIGKKLLEKNDLEEFKKIFINNPEIIEKEIKNFFIGKEDIDGYEELNIKLYKGNRTTENNKRFNYRKKFLKILNKEKILIISKINLVKQINLFMEGKIQIENIKNGKKVLRDVKKYTDNLILELKEEYGNEIINDDLKELKNLETKQETIFFEKEKIEGLLEEIKKIDSKEFYFKGTSLFYLGKKIYTPKKYSDREKFIELFASNPKGTYFKLNEIYNYIEGGGSNLIYLGKEQSKSIYNIKDKINNTIYLKTGIKKFFSLGKGDNKGKICIK